jgi:hypothetical protein
MLNILLFYLKRNRKGIFYFADWGSTNVSIFGGTKALSLPGIANAICVGKKGIAACEHRSYRRTGDRPTVPFRFSRNALCRTA